MNGGSVPYMVQQNELQHAQRQPLTPSQRGNVQRQGPPAKIPKIEPPVQQEPVSRPASVQDGAIMDKKVLDALMRQISPTTVLGDVVKDVLVQYADHFATELIDKACTMIQHRAQKKIEARDIDFLLKNVYHMPVALRSVSGNPRKEAIDLSKEKHLPTRAHRQRVALLKKQLPNV